MQRQRTGRVVQRVRRSLKDALSQSPFLDKVLHLDERDRGYEDWIAAAFGLENRLPG